MNEPLKDLYPHSPAPKVDLLPEIWSALMALYVGSGHGPAPLDLDPSRREALSKCLKKLHKDPTEAGKRIVHLLAYWLFRPNDFWRAKRKGSELIATLLRFTEVSARYTESESWKWNGVIKSNRGPPSGDGPDVPEGIREWLELEF